MIVETDYKKDDVVTMRIIGGEEVIGRLVDTTGDAYTIAKPYALVQMQKGLGLAPYVMTSDPSSKIKMSKGSIVCITKSNTQATNDYIKSTSGIVPASAGVPANKVPKLDIK